MNHPTERPEGVAPPEVRDSTRLLEIEEVPHRPHAEGFGIGLVFVAAAVAALVAIAANLVFGDTPSRSAAGPTPIELTPLDPPASTADSYQAHDEDVQAMKGLTEELERAAPAAQSAAAEYSEYETAYGDWSRGTEQKAEPSP